MKKISILEARKITDSSASPSARNARRLYPSLTVP
jgi:hypothetical protein